jgi:hypothetical protein
MGLGALADVSLVKARDKASAARALVKDGINPIEHTRAQASIPTPPKRHSSPTFEEMAEAYMTDRLKRLRSEVHRDQWRQTLRDYAYPVIGNMPVNEIDTNNVLAVLAAQKFSTAATTAALVSERRSCVPNSSSSCRFTIDPASSSTAGMVVWRSTIS